jgi:hypothetical protein
MSANRIRHLVSSDQGPPDECQRRFRDVMEQGGSCLVDEYIQEHPGNQCYLLVLDPQIPVVRDFLNVAKPGYVASVQRLMEETGGPMPGEDSPLFVAVVSRQAGIQAARYFAKHEDDTQAMLDTMDADAIGLGLIAGSMKIFLMPRRDGYSPAADERARRKARSRRHAT